MKKIGLIIAIYLSINTMLLAQNPQNAKRGDRKDYSIEQATSERAQLHTIAFSGLAFLTGNLGADTFFPPGKVADFFGFQYMRDNDKNEKGHNTDFLTRIANNVIQILSKEQLQQLVALANEQAPLYEQFARKRIELIKLFRGQLDSGTKIDQQLAVRLGDTIYALDASLSYRRAVVVGGIINSLTPSQKAAFAKLDFSDSSTWPILPESIDKRSMSHRAHVGVMTYASELFSWYAGSEKADVYFCPERHATYFGGFFLKDYPAMGNHDYSISTSLTGDKGRDFLEIIPSEGRLALTKAVESQSPLLQEIVRIRQNVSTELRKAMRNETPDRKKVYDWIVRYGELDVQMSSTYATVFCQISKLLTPDQKQQLIKLRNLDVTPRGVYLFSDLIGKDEELK